MPAAPTAQSCPRTTPAGAVPGLSRREQGELDSAWVKGAGRGWFWVLIRDPARVVSHLS